MARSRQRRDEAGRRPGNAYERLELALGRWLRAGSLTSTALLAVGLAGWVAGARGPFSEWAFHAGLTVLMATPVGRVAVSVVEYARERDWFFLAATSTVLAILAATVAAAIRVALDVR